MNAKPQIITLGCRLNAYESEVMRRHANQAGLDNTVIINTCAVTAEAERQARQTIRKVRRQQPDARIIVTGCAAQIDPDKYGAMAEVDQVIGNQEKLKLESFLPRSTDDKIIVSDIMAAKEVAGHLLSGFESRSRALVQIQQGCDHRCTFCIIPYGRGNSRSIATGRLISQVMELVENGYREVVLTGVDISSYGNDLADGPTLGQLAARLLAKVPGLERLRLSSLDPAVVDEELIELLGREPRLMPHLHLSVQAGNDVILKRMKRRHSRVDVLALCQRIRGLRPDVVFGADIITGFPTETEAMFADTVALVEEAGLTYLHVFPYSPRPGTPAAKMPQIPAGECKARAATLRRLGDKAKAHYLETLTGARLSVLTEKNNCGYSEHYAPVRISTAVGSGEIVPVLITGVDDNRLTAVLAA